MITKISIAILVLFSCGTLYLLDQFIKQDQIEDADHMHSFMRKARDEASSRAEAKARFEAQIRADLANCESNATKVNADYVTLIQKAFTNKRGQVVVPQSVLDESRVLLEHASAECKKIYEMKLREA